MIGAIVQARMTSTRLPGKVLMEAAGKPMLGHLLERLDHASTLDHIVVATTTNSTDDAIANYCAACGISTFRGSEHDVLDRYYQTARRLRFDTVVRITADCPLIDPTIVDMLVHVFHENVGRYDLVTNRHPLTFPDGLDLDVMPFAALAYVWQHANEPYEREHTVPYFWEHGMRVHNVEHPENLFECYRWTLDYPEDFALISAILQAFADTPTPPLMNDVVRLLDQRPDLMQLNSHYLPHSAGATA